MNTFTLTALATLALALIQPASAVPLTSDLGIQINFYENTGCHEPNGEAYTYWNHSPKVGRVGTWGPLIESECFTLHMPGDSKSLQALSALSSNGGYTDGECTFYDNWGCGRNEIRSYVKAIEGECIAARSHEGGCLWKSARCYTANSPV